MSEWISVDDDRLPEAERDGLSQYVLAYHTEAGIHQALYCRKDDIWFDTYGNLVECKISWSGFVSHWMPLPAPPAT